MHNTENKSASFVRVNDIKIPQKEINFSKGVFEIQLKNQKIAEYVENGIIRATKLGNIVFRTIKQPMQRLMVCTGESRVLFINYM